VDINFEQSEEIFTIKNSEDIIKKTYKSSNIQISTLKKYYTSEDVFFRVILSPINKNDPENISIRNKYNEQILEKILNLSFSEFPNKLNIMSRIKFNPSNKCSKLEIIKKNNNIHIMCERRHDVQNWINPFSPDKLNDYLIDNFESNTSELVGETYLSIRILCKIEEECKESRIIEKVAELTQLLNSHYDDSINELTQKNSEGVFVKLFDFPPEYKNIYSQYLMWFGEFLKNIGIEANVSIQQENGETAVIVSPKDNIELLNEIEKLFYQYLQLPYVEVLPPQRAMSIQEQHTFMIVKQQVQFLEMQVQTKDTLLLHNNATISSLNTTVARQADLIETQTDKLTLVNALVDKDKWTKVPFTEGTFKCKNFGKKTMSIQFEPLAAFNKLVNKKDESIKDDE
jgi:hypothetical protein